MESLFESVEPVKGLSPRIYTGYFGASKRYIKAGLGLISIARYQPRFVSVNQVLLELAPKPDLLRLWKAGTISKEEWQDVFKRYLKTLNANKMMERIPNNTILLCYESLKNEEDWCHRTLVSEWIRQETGICVTEF